MIKWFVNGKWKIVDRLECLFFLVIMRSVVIPLSFILFLLILLLFFCDLKGALWWFVLTNGAVHYVRNCVLWP